MREKKNENENVRRKGEGKKEIGKEKTMKESKESMRRKRVEDWKGEGEIGEDWKGNY